MKKIVFFICLYLCTYSFVNAGKVINNDGPFKHWSIGAGVSTTGIKFEIGTSLGDFFSFRGGVHLLPYDFKTDFDISAENYKAYMDNKPTLRINGNINFMQGSAMIDFTPVRNGVFSITFGALIGSPKISANGVLVDSKTGKNAMEILKEKGQVEALTFKYDNEYELKPANDGSVEADIVLGKKSIKPYIGIGLGRAVPRNRVGLRLDVGAAYLGGIDVTSKNVIKGDLNNLIDSKDFKDYKSYLNWLPVVSLQINVRLN